MRFLSISIVLMISLLSCSLSSPDSSGDDSGIDVRFTVESDYGSSSSIHVYLEGEDGNMVTGSSVIVRNSGNSTSLLPFSYNDSCYTGALPVSSDGQYSLLVDSFLLSDTRILNFSHYILSAEPGVQMLQNQDGTSALSGSNLSIHQAIQIGWNDISGATLYQVAIYRDGNLLYLASEGSTVHEIASGNLTSTGTCSIQISAQYIEGDPLFNSAHYYSFSEAAGATVYFELE